MSLDRNQSIEVELDFFQGEALSLVRVGSDSQQLLLPGVSQSPCEEGHLRGAGGGSVAQETGLSLVFEEQNPGK